MKISEEGKALIKKFEGCKLEAYKCPAGVWSIGFGFTKDVQEGDVWSQTHAEENTHRTYKHKDTHSYTHTHTI